jgi:Ca2+ transporting ATPase
MMQVVCIFLAAAVGMPETLVPVQLLWVNLVTDGLPATALGFNKPDGDIMRQRPRKAAESIVDGWMFFRYLVIGLYVGLVTVGGYAWWFLWYAEGPQMTWSEFTDYEECVEGEKHYSCAVFRDRHASTISMTVLVVVEMFNALNALSENGSLLTTPPWSNRWLVAAIAVSMALHVVILYVPFLAVRVSVLRRSLSAIFQSGC